MATANEIGPSDSLAAGLELTPWAVSGMRIPPSWGRGVNHGPRRTSAALTPPIPGPSHSLTVFGPLDPIRAAYQSALPRESICAP
jgi:hypothetical protein